MAAFSTITPHVLLFEDRSAISNVARSDVFIVNLLIVNCYSQHLTFSGPSSPGPLTVV